MLEIIVFRLVSSRELRELRKLRMNNHDNQHKDQQQLQQLQLLPQQIRVSLYFWVIFGNAHGSIS